MWTPACSHGRRKTEHLASKKGASHMPENELKLFYYPYASFTAEQHSLLRVAALYFDKLILLDPVGASWDIVGVPHPKAREELQMLKEAGILEIVTPAAVLKKYETSIADAIHRDMVDREFLELCEAEAKARGKQRWTLALAKVPQDVLAEQTMSKLLGDLARNVASEAGRYSESGRHSGDAASEYWGYAQDGKVFDELRRDYNSTEREYRYADFPLALGEAIMMNHALFTGLLYADATPITDDPFHNRALSLKLRRVLQEPAIQQAQRDRARQLKIDLLAFGALTDSQLNLPILSPEVPLKEVVKYRQQHGAALKQARDKLGWMARRIEAEPWSTDFAEELEHKTIPDIAMGLDEARKARDAWLKSERFRLGLSITSVVAGTAAAVLSVFAAPLTPVVLAAAGASFVSGVAIPGIDQLLEWRAGRTSAQENGLHYLLRI